MYNVYINKEEENAKIFISTEFIESLWFAKSSTEDAIIEYIHNLHDIYCDHLYENIINNSYGILVTSKAEIRFLEHTFSLRLNLGYLSDKAAKLPCVAQVFRNYICLDSEVSYVYLMSSIYEMLSPVPKKIKIHYV